MARAATSGGPLLVGEVAARLLSPQAGPLEPPLRAELMGPARLAEQGRTLALAQVVAAPGERRGTFFPRLQENLHVLRDACALLEAHARRGHRLAPAADWLIDHASLLERQFDTVRTSLPARYYARLPRLAGEPLDGLPRVYGLVWAWVAHTDSGLDEDLLESFLAAYQRERELTLAELWAIPTTLRVVLVENLRRLAEQAATLQAARDAAHRWIERTPEPGDDARLKALGDDLARRGALESFALQLQRRSDEFPPQAAPLLRSWLTAHLPDPAGALQRQQQVQAEDHQSVRNAVTSLRALDRVDWRGVLMRSSAALAGLQSLPVFAAEAEETQDLTLHDLEVLARRAGVPESRVGQALVALVHGASTQADAPPAAAAPQYWLRGPGRAALMQTLGLPDTMERLRRAARRAATPAYLGIVWLGTVALVTSLVMRYAHPQLPAWALALTVLLLAGPASETVLALLHRLISESLPPTRLPRLALPEGIPPEMRTLVVMPVMLTSPATVPALVAQLEQHHLANPERHAQFALLSDFADAPQQQLAGDRALLQAAARAIEQLNRRHAVPPGEPQRFLLLHRHRTWSDTERCWMGWERKRGKLEQLLAWLVERGTPPWPGATGNALPAPGVRSVVTLDSDTDMPPGRLRELVAIHAHPLNAPLLDPSRRRVIAGYAILQPRVAVPLPQAGSVTTFHWLFSGQWGVDPYSVASSEIYQDLFGEGTFTGKGLLDVQAVHTLLAGRLPTGQVLSHDLLEGALARCATVSDVTLVEDAPAHPDVAASRLHRWTRGDWQLLPFLLHPRRWPMAAISRWKMADNLRRSLVAPSSLALLLWVLASGAMPLPAALLLVAAAYGAGPLLGALASLAPPRDDLALGLFFRHAGVEMLRAVAGAAWHVTLLPAQALLSVDAIARAAWRQLASRRMLLQWTTAAAAQAAARTDLPSLWRRHRRVTLVAGLLLAALLLWRTLVPPLGDTLAPLDTVAALCLLWASTPMLVWLASLRLPVESERVDETSRARLQALALDTWRYYERHVGEADHHLPPDNVQVTQDPPLVAHRTSPTNIGLYLLGVAAARELGFIDTTTMLQRLELTLQTLDRLPRWRGHFYNWIDTRTLATLAPAYVSTVDSGNLSGHLLVLSAACEALAAASTESAPGMPEPDPALRDRAARIAAHARGLALAADFGALYDPRRRLMHIGIDVDADRLDASHYDLLASEARLASLVGIAKGDLPPRHWSALGRPLFAAHGRVGLRSWSGSMFEYLMPSLVLDEPAGSLLQQATRTAVAVQRAEAAPLGTPWGVSESAIAVQDHTLAYQYGPQGVASLALRRTPADERVIAPYASAMALVVAPQAAADNLQALAALGARRELGYIESLDYTAHRQPVAAERPTTGGYTPVLTYMAHHQGMTLLACAHVLGGGAVRRWAAAQPHLRAVMPLLHEPAPHLVPLRRERSLPMLQAQAPGQRWQYETQPDRSALPATHLLGNDRHAVLLRDNGAGCSLWQGHGLTRWRDDALRDTQGSFAWLMRPQDRRWQPLAARPGPPRQAGDTLPEYATEFHPDRALLHARWADLQATTTVSVSTGEDCEVRHVQLHNTGRRPLRVVVAMAFEATLAPQRADEVHPAFSNLFVRARWSARERAMFLQRRPRLLDEPTLHAVHFVAGCDDPLARVHALADRARWLGRLGDPAQPLATAWAMPEPAGAREAAPPIGLGSDDDGETGDGTELDTGLDPVSVLMVELTVPARGSRALSFVLGAAHELPALQALVDRYRQPAAARRALELSDTLARIRLRELKLDADTWVAWLHLNTLVTGSLTRPLQAAPAEAVDRRALWRHGIGGDRPVVLLWIESAEGLDLARQLVGMLALWTAAGQPLDLVVVNGEPASYQPPVQQSFAALTELAARRMDAQLAPERRAALKLLHARDLPPAELATLRLLARVSLQADGRPLAQHIGRALALHEDDRLARARLQRLPLAVPRPDADATAPQGRFEPADDAFRFEVDTRRSPPRPWINVLANPGFGSQVSESGTVCTWAGNSRMHQITAGSNDPLCDPPCEALWLHDLDGRRAWWLGRGAGAERREVVHGIGTTRMRQAVDGMQVTLQWCVDAEAAVRQVQVEVAMPSPGAAAAPRRLRLVAFAEWTMGSGRGERATVVTRPWRWGTAGGDGSAVAPGRPVAEGGPAGLAVLATQCDASLGHGGATAFLCWTGSTAQDAADWTCDRREFFDAGGRWTLPAQLGMQAGAGLDACGAVACRVEVAPGRTARATLLLGHASAPEAAGRLAQEACATPPQQRLSRQLAIWPALLDDVRVHSPDPLFDAMVNRWLPYQAIACRLWARAGFYQAGGAFGFRDQLQDAMNLAPRAPALLAQQLRIHAARQFEQGDVQHWWHPPGGAGVRTRMTDDLLWLPLALAHAVRHGQPALTDEAVPFLRGSAVPPEREDVYETPTATDERASLYEHGARAIDHCLEHVGVGAHGLPLMGTGDWNDGMNRVGFEGRGESVWLAWFLCRVVDDYVPLAAARGDARRVARWQRARTDIGEAIDAEAWDGAWYRRAYFDDGSPLGAAGRDECRIDLIAQAWAVLSGAGDPARAAQAMASARELLWDGRWRLMRLLDPPLALSRPQAGYIQAYPAGVRENGGQYNHAAVWALMACAELGDAAGAWDIYTGISPAHRSADPALARAYGLEPYVLAGDIYSQAPWAGRGGWSWYTGAASWLQRAALESICGLRLHAGRLTLAPCLPPHWPQVEMTVRWGAATHRVTVLRDTATYRGLLAAGGERVLPVHTGQVVELHALGQDSQLVLLLDEDAAQRAAPAAGTSDTPRRGGHESRTVT